MAMVSFLRLVTSPKIFRAPTPIEHAVAFLDALLATPGVQLAQLGPEWSKLRQLCLEKSLSGNGLSDAWLSAAVAQLGEHLITSRNECKFASVRGRGCTRDGWGWVCLGGRLQGSNLAGPCRF